MIRETLKIPPRRPASFLDKFLADSNIISLFGVFKSRSRFSFVVVRMNSEESSEYTWKILEENHVIVPIHLKNILCNLGYIGIRVLAKIDDSTIKEIEEFVSKVLGSAEMTKNMSLTEKQEQFGKTFASKPEHFMLSPGDKAVLRVISEVCTQILESYSIVSFPPDEMKKKFKIKHSKATTSMYYKSCIYYYFS